ncbi:MAG: ABC transporter permease, partial [Chloroflexota bacterium]
MHRQFIYRQLISSPKQTAVFIICVALSIITLVSLGGFGDSVNESLLRDARQLLAGDVVIESGFPYLDPIDQEIEALRAEQGVEVSRTYEFISVVRPPEIEETLVSEIKVVEAGYPFYGEVFLDSGEAFQTTLQSGTIIVGQALLDRLELSVGDELVIGSSTLTIADVVLSEPDQPVDFFNLGPRIFISAEDLEAIDLVRPGSLVRFRTLLRVDDAAQVD